LLTYKLITMKNLFFIHEGRLYITPHYSLKLITMKLFKTAFGLNLLVVLMFSFISFLAYMADVDVSGFFAICAIVFLVLLPACSREEH